MKPTRIGMTHLFVELLVIGPLIFIHYGFWPAMIWLFIVYRLEGIDLILRILGKSGIVTEAHIKDAMNK